MVDVNHESLTKVSSIKPTKVKINYNIDYNDLRLIECQNEETRQSYFVVHPTPESIGLNPFGESGPNNVVSDNFILT